MRNQHVDGHCISPAASSMRKPVIIMGSTIVRVIYVKRRYLLEAWWPPWCYTKQSVFGRLVRYLDWRQAHYCSFLLPMVEIVDYVQIQFCTCTTMSSHPIRCRLGQPPQVCPILNRTNGWHILARNINVYIENAMNNIGEKWHKKKKLFGSHNLESLCWRHRFWNISEKILLDIISFMDLL